MYIGQVGMPPETTALLPPQAPPVQRAVVSSAVATGIGVQPCDNDHNTDTEHDIFFIKMT
jgi:hypothetical protein